MTDFKKIIRIFYLDIFDVKFCNRFNLIIFQKTIVCRQFQRKQKFLFGQQG
jgi:hypothetical protein